MSATRADVSKLATHLAALDGIDPARVTATPVTFAPEYVCAGCLHPIEGPDISDMHSVDGEDFHAECCPGVPRCGVCKGELVVADDARWCPRCDSPTSEIMS